MRRLFQFEVWRFLLLCGGTMAMVAGPVWFEGLTTFILIAVGGLAFIYAIWTCKIIEIKGVKKIEKK